MQLGCRLTFHYHSTAGDNTVNKQTQASEVRRISVYLLDLMTVRSIISDLNHYALLKIKALFIGIDLSKNV